MKKDERYTLLIDPSSLKFKKCFDVLAPMTIENYPPTGGETVEEWLEILRITNGLIEQGRRETEEDRSTWELQTGRSSWDCDCCYAEFLKFLDSRHRERYPKAYEKIARL